MKRFPTFMALLPALMLSACHDNRAPTKRNFEAAMNRYYAKHCISVGTDYFGNKFPLEIAIHDKDGYSSSFDAEKRKKWDALVAVGLLSAEDKDVTSKDFLGQPHTSYMRIYSLTEKGRPFLQDEDNTTMCVGHYKVTSIRKFDGPHFVPWLGNIEVVDVRDKRAPTNVPDWAKDKRVTDAWPELGPLLKSDQEGDMSLINGKKGWVAEKDYLPS